MMIVARSVLRRVPHHIPQLVRCCNGHSSEKEKVNLNYDEKNQRWNNKDGSAYTGKTTKFSNMVLSDLKMNQKTDLGNAIVSNLATDKLDHYIKRGDPNDNRTDDPNIYYSGSASSSDKILQGAKRMFSPSYVALGHEMAQLHMMAMAICFR